MPLRPAGRRGGVRRLNTARAHVVVRGRVQGVFFRSDARQRARSLALTGWVRNNTDGTVEAVFEGDRERVGSMVEWCRRGPSGALVEDVDVDWAKPQGEAGFSVQGGWA
ncbi:MAG TPA: acylphosphatase [Gaiellaceae bacterium]|nr:acylphosphatase [Gaiellaceae bacterium]